MKHHRNAGKNQFHLLGFLRNGSPVASSSSWTPSHPAKGSHRKLVTYVGHLLLEYVAPEADEQGSESSQDESQCAQEAGFRAPLFDVHRQSFDCSGKGEKKGGDVKVTQGLHWKS